MRTPFYNIRHTLGTGAACLLLLVCFLFVVSSGAGPDQERLETFESLVERWMTLRSTLATERREEQQRLEHWHDEQLLLEKEKQQLEEELAALDELVAPFEQQRKAAHARHDTMEQQRLRVHDALLYALDDLALWDRLIPDGLRPPHDDPFATLPADRDEARRQPTAHLAQNIVAVYIWIEHLQNEFHAAHEILDTGQGRRHVDVIYAGLARGFAVAKDNNWAAIGFPGDSQWHWTPRPGLAPAIRRAHDVLERRKPARLIELPFRVLAPKEEEP